MYKEYMNKINILLSMMLSNILSRNANTVLSPEYPGDHRPEVIEKLLSEDVKVKLRREFDHKKPRPKKVQQIKLVENTPRASLSKGKKDPFIESIQTDIGGMLRHVPTYMVTTKEGDIVVSIATVSEDILPDPRTKKPVPQPKKKEREPLLLFFMGKDEAKLYLNKIFNDEPEISEQLGIRITKTTLETFYRVNRDEKCKVDARLISDLEESHFMLSTRRKNEFYTINPKQRYKRNFFQGTPIYILKHTIGPYVNDSQYTLRGRQIYFKWSDALSSWEKSVTSEHMKKNIKPNIEVYNLENLLQEMEEDDEEDFSAYTFMPPIIKNEVPDNPIKKK
ncbi:hypothetical protein CRPAC_p002 (plastid) [Cryptomonas paramecium]|uniref:Uncharacterized protein n=1 Tax=Cryptomonas paramaecium TaxID=2898 RepID=D2IS63_9CRYP|nr:hypothetical protein CRPAC_p002 [Cryptomonas paramecium]ACT46755.1 hypothetical protein CRPAC_p002 [Cryptomonas paramecium]